MYIETTWDENPANYGNTNQKWETAWEPNGTQGMRGNGWTERETAKRIELNATRLWHDKRAIHETGADEEMETSSGKNK